MNPQDPLANLHPLREPELIGWWPPAPGWWVLLFVGILCLSLLVYFIRRHYRKNAYRRQALHQLQSLHAEYQADGNAHYYLAQVNALLKSVALLAYPRDEVAAQHGAQWRAFINRSLPASDRLKPAFDDAAYQKTLPDIDVAQEHRAAHQWIRHHKVAL